MKLTNIVAFFALIFSITSGNYSYAQEKVLKVGSTPTAIPFTFLDVKTNSIQGILVDIIREIAEDSLFKIEIESIQFSSLIPSLTGNKIDIIAAAMFINPKRQEVIDFSRPIITYGEGLIVPKSDTLEYTGLADLKGKIIGVQKGTLFVESIEKSGLFSEVRIYDNIPSIIADVQAGRIHAGIIDKPIVVYNLQHGAYSNIRLVKSYISSMSGSIGIGVRKGDTALLGKINASIQKLQKNGAIDKIIAKWTGLEST
ncbi:MAG: ABC transporter substrate-binding protein [Polynucleobacter sp.]|jgi:polar amino acid transport system substrate-binding protein